MQVPHPNEVVQCSCSWLQTNSINSHFSKLSVVEKGNPTAQLEDRSVCANVYPHDYMWTKFYSRFFFFFFFFC